MNVDHVVEMQVAPIGRESALDVMENYRPMDRQQNSSSGGEMRQNIIRLREQLAQASGDPAWLTCDMTFQAVRALGAAGRDIWEQDELIAGKQIDAYVAFNTKPVCKP